MFPLIPYGLSLLKEKETDVGDRLSWEGKVSLILDGTTDWLIGRLRFRLAGTWVNLLSTPSNMGHKGPISCLLVLCWAPWAFPCLFYWEGIRDKSPRNLCRPSSRLVNKRSLFERRRHRDPYNSRSVPEMYRARQTLLMAPFPLSLIILSVNKRQGREREGVSHNNKDMWSLPQ